MITSNLKKELDVYLFAGQSNAGGPVLISNVSSEYRYYLEDSQSFVWFNQDYNSIEHNLVSFKAGKTYRPGQVAEGGMAFETSLMYNLGRNGNSNSVLLKIGIGGAGLDTTQANTWSTARNDSLYTAFTNNVISSLISTYVSQGYTINFKCLIWVQGERDGTLELTANRYENNQTSFFNGIRSFIGVDIPILDFKLSTQISEVTVPFWQTINTAKDNVASTLTGITQIDFSDLELQSDNLHYTADSFIIGGERVFEIIKDF